MTPKAANEAIPLRASAGNPPASWDFAALSASGSACQARRLRHNGQREIIAVAAGITCLKVIPTRADDRALTQIAERAGNRLAPIVLTTVNTVPTGNGLVPRAVSTKCASGLIATVVAEIWSACTWTVSTLQR